MAKSISEKCITCNAPLKFNGKTDLFECEYCGNKFTIEELDDYKKKLKEKKKQETSNKKNKSFSADAYHCENCGANIILGENTSSTSCIYCKSSAIIQNRLEDVYEPSRIITFKYSKEDAINKFKELCKGRRLMPNDFDNIKNISSMEGLYVPFWLYNCENNSSLHAKCENITTWTDSKYINTKTDYYDVYVSGLLSFNHVPNDAASRFDDKIMNAIEPFDYQEFKKFNMSYLSGYISEKYDVKTEDAYVNAKNRIDDDSKNYLFNKISGFTHKSIRNYNSNVSLLNDEYVLLPVWVLNIKYKEKIYRFSMNGQTGKMVGEIPVDTKKLWLSIIINFSLFLIIGLVIMLIVGGVR